MLRIIRNAGAGSARQLGSQLLSEGLRTRDRADELRIETILSERAKRDSIAESLNDFARFQAENRAQRKADRAGKKSAVGGLIGTGVGAIAGIVLAPFTAGASLALTAAVGAGVGSAVGSAVGSLAEDSPGSGLRASDQVQSATRQLGSAAQAQENRNAARDIAGTRREAAVEAPLDAFFRNGPVDEAQFGFEDGPAAEAGKTVGLNKDALEQPAAEPAPVVDVGFGLAYDPTTGEFVTGDAASGKRRR